MVVVEKCVASRRVWPSLLALALLAPAAAAAEPGATNPIDEALARLEVALAAHPDDPDLEWAFAQTLSRGGQAERAAERMARFAARWPERREDVHLQLGRMLFDAGRNEEARERLSFAVRRSPRSGTARFYHALALRELGRRQEARAELIRSGALAPSLKADATLLLSIDAFAAGKEEEGVRFAQDVIRFDPTSDAAARARMLLREKDLAATQRSWRADGYVGFEYDDNVTLTQDRDNAAASDRDDFKGVWGVGLAWRHALTNDVQAIAGYRLDQSMHDDLSDFDYLNNAIHVGGLVKVHPRVALRLDLIGWNARLDGEQYLWAGTARPSVLWVLPENAGLLRLFANVELRAFEQKPFDDALEQDGWTFGGGAEWNVELPGIDGTTSLSAAYHETKTDAGSTPSNVGDFDGDYDLRRLRIHHRMRVPLPLEFELGSDVSYSRGWYSNDNFAAFLSDFFLLPVSEIDGRKRRDHEVSGRVFLARPLHRFVRVEVEYKPSRRYSNIDIFDYERHVVGLVMRIQTD